MTQLLAVWQWAQRVSAGRKTYVVSIAFIIASISQAYVNNQPINWHDVAEGVIAITLRAGIAKAVKGGQR